MTSPLSLGLTLPNQYFNLIQQEEGGILRLQPEALPFRFLQLKQAAWRNRRNNQLNVFRLEFL